ncbi:MAG: hypothetical protein AAF639_04195 [Chloroflexota bacterium]
MKKAGRTVSKQMWARVSIITMLAFVLVSVWAYPSVYAFEGRSGESVLIAADEVIDDDVYAGASEIVVDGTITGDLIAGAQTLTINGAVEGDVWFGGQTLTVNGTIGDDIRMGGTLLKLNPGSSVGDDILMGGFSLEAEPESTVGGDILYGGYQVLLAGTLEGDLEMGGGALEIQGRINGNVNAEVGTSEDTIGTDPMAFVPDAPDVASLQGGLTIGENAFIGGDLNYTSREEFLVPTSVIKGDTMFELIGDGVEEPTNPFDPMRLLFGTLRQWIGLILVGILLAWLVPSMIPGSAKQLAHKTVPSLGWGALVLIVTPFVLFIGILIAILLTILFGLLTLEIVSSFIGFAGITTIFTLAVFFGLTIGVIAKLIVGYWLGSMITGGDETGGNLSAVIVALVIGLLIVAALSHIPFLGGVINLVIAILGLGALWLMRRGEAPKPVDPFEMVNEV